MVEEELWQGVRDRSPAEIAAAAIAEHDPANGTFTIRVLGDRFVVDAGGRSISSPDAVRRSHLLTLFLLHHLANAKELPLSGTLVTPNQLTGGNFYFRASHELPLHRIAAKYENDVDGFFRRGAKLGGEAVAYGDAAVKVPLLPRVPLVFVLWKRDDEFESQVHLMLDKSVEQQMSLEGLMLALLYAIGKWVED